MELLKQIDKKKGLTESNKMFEDLKSRNITGLSASCRKARPFAAAKAIFILADHGKGAEYPVKVGLYKCSDLYIHVHTNSLE